MLFGFSFKRRFLTHNLINIYLSNISYVYVDLLENPPKIGERMEIEFLADRNGHRTIISLIKICNRIAYCTFLIESIREILINFAHSHRTIINPVSKQSNYRISSPICQGMLCVCICRIYIFYLFKFMQLQANIWNCQLRKNVDKNCSELIRTYVTINIRFI